MTGGSGYESEAMEESDGPLPRNELEVFIEFELPVDVDHRDELRCCTRRGLRGCRGGESTANELLGEGDGEIGCILGKANLSDEEWVVDMGRVLVRGE